MAITRRKIEYTFRPLAIGGFMLVAASWAGAAVASSNAPQAAQPPGSSLVALCTPCHGPQGISRGPATPTIAGLSRNYMIGAMLAYKFPDDLGRADALIEQDQDIEDVVVLARPPGIMNAIAEMLSVEEMKAVAAYFSAQDFVAPVQNAGSAQVAAGTDIHQRYCEKCHEDGGRSTADDVGLLAGQWKLYLTYLFEDLSDGYRQMPKKMATKIEAVRADHGDEGIQQLINYYAARNAAEEGS